MLNNTISLKAKFILIIKNFMNNQIDHPNEEQAYKKIKVLGEGSMGKAYLVQSSKDNQYYVMKRINIGHLTEDQKASASRQAQLHSILNSQYIIGFKEIYHTTKDKLCLIMQYAECGDLDKFIKQQNGIPIAQEMILQYFTQICLGTKQIHEKKIIHRDLKGANIFITSDKRLKIGDFGISKVLDKTIISSKSFVGTPYYLSPQMVQGKPYSSKSDIWSLGVILYHMCAQKLPFQTNSLPLLALKIIRGNFPPITTGNYSKQLKTLILNLLQVDQRKRPTILQLLTKPILRKYLPKQMQNEINNKFSQQKLTVKPTKPPIKTQSKKPKLSQQQVKQQQKQKRQQYKEKREQQQKKMKEDIRKKRKQKQQTTITSQQGLLINSSGIQLKAKKKKQKDTKTNISTTNDQQNKKSKNNLIKASIQTAKPWKTNKLKSKKQIEVQIFLPEDRSKQTKIQPKEEIISNNDIKVQIFVSGKPFLENKKQKSVEKLTIKQKQINLREYESQHMATKKISSNSQQQSYQQEIIEQNIEDNRQYNINEILKDIKGAQNLVNNLKNPFGEIQLYQQSENFQNTLQYQAQNQQNLIQSTEQENQHLKYITNSQNLQQLRLILQERLGEQNFLLAYNIIKEHAEQAIYKSQSSQKLQQQYGFNRTILQQKLHFLTTEQFDKNIVLLYTLSILQDEQMKNNFDDEDDDSL